MPFLILVATKGTTLPLRVSNVVFSISGFISARTRKSYIMCAHLGVNVHPNKRAWHHSGLLVHAEESALWMPEKLLPEMKTNPLTGWMML